jgi:osmotically-inducible protein OsmY
MPRQDLAIREDICRELEWEPQVEAAHIGVAVEDGIATLSGHVSSFAEKVAAERAARRIKGVRAIVLAIEVHLPESDKRTDEEIARSVVRTLEWDELVPHHRIAATVQHGIVTLEGTVERAFHRDEAELDVRKIKGVNGLINKVTIGPSGEPSPDEIKQALSRSASLDASGIRVAVSDGRVVLSGLVQQLNERHEAERIAWAGRGVREVDNRIDVAAI